MKEVRPKRLLLCDSILGKDRDHNQTNSFQGWGQRERLTEKVDLHSRFAQDVPVLAQRVSFLETPQFQANWNSWSPWNLKRDTRENFRGIKLCFSKIPELYP